MSVATTTSPLRSHAAHTVSDDQPTGAQKRAFYVPAFCIALGIDLVMSLGQGEAYRPSLVGLAIMIAAVIWFAVSWIRER